MIRNAPVKSISISLLFFGFFSFGQVKKLNDPSIVAHNKRMVFESWGDFRPYPKYVLGVQTNFAYATVKNKTPRRIAFLLISLLFYH